MVFVVMAGTAAKPKDAKSVLLHYDVTVAGSHLASGNYDVQWQTHSPEATVSFMRGSRIVATVEGKVVDHGTAYPSNEVVYGVGANGAREIQEIRFKGLSEVVDFN